MAPRQRILITGAAGRIGQSLATLLPRDGRRLRLFDRHPATPGSEEDEILAGDMLDPAHLATAMEGCDAVVHLAAEKRAFSDDHASVLALNCIGAQAVFEAARQAGVRRFVFASSHHAVGEYPIGQPVPPQALPRPDGLYGASKVFGEAVGQLYADVHGMAVVSIRIGAFQDAPTTPRQLVVWISPRDMAALVDRALVAELDGHRVVYGYSGNPANPTRDPGWAQLGYVPCDAARPEHLTLPPPDTRLGGRVPR
ncbi:NAD(P)-dependent oxidoreductase [Roseomonas sp. E05]|uniref:NAD-dependent epimerase/dehydratase family protein n=1 Tax=Roseomonas sp. E05 TaxID=3046310 RepID=UPI0024BA7F14|nr:NAD(P)-dependent oxidoreductase [Roseomonas sp. E05]MDJ0387319.1 NAD(P)-dependent oxidoreductase [Roseomonas sp. E05]